MLMACDEQIVTYLIQLINLKEIHVNELKHVPY